MRKQKFYFAIISILITAILLSSCGIIIINRGDKETSVTEAEETTKAVTGISPDGVLYHTVETEDYYKKAKEYLKELPDLNFDGLSVLIAYTGDTIISPSEDSVYSEAVSERDKLVESKFGTSIIRLPSDNLQALLDETATAYNSGDYYADFAAIPQSALGLFQSKNILYNLKSLPYTDYTLDYFDSEAMDQASAGNFIYAAIGEATKDIGDMYCVYVNKTLAKNLGPGFSYTKAYRGEWTWELFNTYLKSLSDINADGAYYGFGSSLDIDGLRLAAYTSSGQYFMNTAFGMLPERCFDTPATGLLLSVIDTFTAYRSTAFFSDDGSGTEISALDAFKNGSMLFYIGTVNNMYDLENANFLWGVLPMPKLDANQEKYSTYVAAQATVLSRLSSESSVDTAGLALQALNAASYGFIRGEFYEKALRDIVCDSDTLSMLDRIYSGARYDFTYMFGNSSASLWNATCGAFISVSDGYGTLQGYYSQTERALAKYLNSYFNPG